jgi:hypothetical protein
MSTTQAVVAAQRVDVQPLDAGGMQVRLKAERVQGPRSAAVGDDSTYLYEFSVNRLQPVTIEVPLVVVTFHGQPSWDEASGKTK